jgi:hypothetical protein
MHDAPLTNGNAPVGVGCNPQDKAAATPSTFVGGAPLNEPLAQG